MVIEVLVEIKAKKLDKTFTYHVPEKSKKIEVGMRVLVPFGKQTLEGFVLKIVDPKTIDYELKDIIDVVDDHPVINNEMLELGEYISKKTQSTLINAYQSMLPSALKAKKNLTINKKYVSYLILKDKEYTPKLEKQRNLINLFKNNQEVLKSDAQKISISSVKTLLDKGVLEEIQKEEYRIINDYEMVPKTIELNEEQSIVVNKVIKSLDNFKPFLLYGVTGSGKTEVYMHIIEEVEKQEKETIVLVPEISLTPQMVDLFKKRFGNKIAILHSRLNDGEKYDEWRKIERGEVSIVIGARSAIFAPFTNLGLIIIDEEHTNTYKQDNNPRYNAIDIALYRGKKYNAPVLLGSATPSIESYTRAKANIYELLTLKKRVNNNLPKTILIDMHEEIKKGRRIISGKMYEAINECLEKKEQIILLLNRRGYSTVITCHDCGTSDKCPNCDIPLTYHRTTNKMKCHYCNLERYKLQACPVCSSSNINQFGMGTEKLEQEINKLFKNAKTLRMDIDTTTKKGAHEKIITSFRNHEYDILIGTQMISKGLDFPNVTLVGVINGDSSLNIPDFRSAERTFQLLNQVAGRAGRADKPGLVIIQAFNISHYSIRYASTHNYQAFYDEELKIRGTLKYPPYYNLTLIKIMSTDFQKCSEAGHKIAEYLKQKLDNTIILGPSAATIPKINNTYYMQIILKYKKSDHLYEHLNAIQKNNLDNKVNIEIDINPMKI